MISGSQNFLKRQEIQLKIEQNKLKDFQNVHNKIKATENLHQFQSSVNMTAKQSKMSFN